MVKNDKNDVKLKKEVSFCLKEVYKCTFTSLFWIYRYKFQNKHYEYICPHFSFLYII